MKKIAIIVVVIIVLVAAFLFFRIIPRSSAPGAADMQKIVETMHRDDPDEFQAVMEAFVKEAINGNLDGMVALTSKSALDGGGVDGLKEYYRTNIMVMFQKYPNMSEGGSVEYVTLPSGDKGWAFKKVFSPKEGSGHANVSTIVVKEQGKIRVAGFEPWKQ